MLELLALIWNNFSHINEGLINYILNVLMEYSDKLNFYYKSLDVKTFH